MEPIQTKSKSGTYLTIGIVVVVLIVVGLLLSHKKSTTDDMVTPAPVDTTVPDTTTPVTSPKSTTTGPGIDPEREGISTSNAGVYANLMLKYKDHMVQFNKQCQVVTVVQGWKQGTDILLDNRAAISAKIVIGSRTFVLPGYGYKVIDLPTVGKFVIDCNARQNVTTITVQK
jgi:hypothetical protein